MEKIKNIVSMYRNEKITEYVLEREIADFMGEKSHVIVSKDNKNIVSRTFAIFVLPQLMSDGFHMTYIIDKNAIREFYTPDEFIVVLARLRDRKQNILLKFNKFILEGKENDISYEYALGFLMNLYTLYMGEFRINANSENFLPEVQDLSKYMDKFNTETGERTDLESLLLKGYICEEIEEFIKKYVHSAPKDDSLTLKVVRFEEYEVPQFNLGQQEIKKLCSSTLGTRDHKEIPHDYLPPR